MTTLLLCHYTAVCTPPAQATSAPAADFYATIGPWRGIPVSMSVLRGYSDSGCASRQTARRSPTRTSALNGRSLRFARSLPVGKNTGCGTNRRAIFRQTSCQMMPDTITTARAQARAPYTGTRRFAAPAAFADRYARPRKQIERSVKQTKSRGRSRHWCNGRLANAKSSLTQGKVCRVRNTKLQRGTAKE